MRRTRLFHTVVIIGSSLLASCEKGPAPVAKKDGGTKDATAKVAPNVPLIDAPPAPMIQAMPPPPRIQAAPVAPMIQAAPPPVRVQKQQPAPPRIQVRRNPQPKAPRIPRI